MGLNRKEINRRRVQAVYFKKYSYSQEDAHVSERRQGQDQRSWELDNKTRLPTQDWGPGAAKHCWGKGRSTLLSWQEDGGKAQAVSYDFTSKGICQEPGWQRHNTQEAPRVCSSCYGRSQSILEKWSGTAGPWWKAASQHLSRETLPTVTPNFHTTLAYAQPGAL